MGSVCHLWTGTKTGETRRRSFHIKGNGRDHLGGGDACGGGSTTTSAGLVLSSLLPHPPPPPPPPHAPPESVYKNSSKLTMSAESLSDATSALQTLALTLALPAQAAAGRRHVKKGNEQELTLYDSKWLHWMKIGNKSSKKKEKARADKAFMHATLTVAGVAAAMLGVTSKQPNYLHPAAPNYVMQAAMTSAAELLASHLIELAHQTGVDHRTMASTIQSGVNVSTSSDLRTLTAAAATSLRAVAVLKDRMQNDRLRRVSVVPCGTNIPDLFCKEGPLRKKTRRGLRWKHVNIYINKESQIVLKLKNKHTGASFFKSKTSVVYGVRDVISGRWQGGEEMWFTLNTAHGLMEFLCENEIQKQKWVAWVRNLLHQPSVGGDELAKPSQKLKMS